MGPFLAAWRNLVWKESLLFCIPALACLLILRLPVSSHAQNQAIPTTLNIGALISLNSTIGRFSKMALELALEKVNSDQNLLTGTKLVLHVGDTKCSAFQGAVAAMNLFEANVVAILGPQTSTESHFVAHMAEAAHVPLISFSATDPALTEFQYPYFTRVIYSDAEQMAAVAGIIKYYGWREVVALFTDDDYGNNAIEALNIRLEQFGSKIVHKASFGQNISETSVASVLVKLADIESQVFIVHMRPDLGYTVLSVAFSLRMMSTGHVWIVTDGIANFLDAISYLDIDVLKSTQGVIGTRDYIPASSKLKVLQSELKTQIRDAHLEDELLDSYALFAYDALWIVAQAVHTFLSQQRTVSFVDDVALLATRRRNSSMAKLKVFKEGNILLKHILKTNFSGVTGVVRFDSKGDRINSAFEVVNLVGKGLRTVGYWSDDAGCSRILPYAYPKDRFNSSNMIQHLDDVIWPGGSAKVPTGWVGPTQKRKLRIGVPNKTGYKEFVSITVDANNKTIFSGYCIDVFKAAISDLPYSVPYEFVSLGSGSSNPTYDKLTEMVANKEIDAAVGDIVITAMRSKEVDFTQPYINSGLVVVVPERQYSPNRAWAFLIPFTPAMWFTILAFLLFTGLVLWMLEHKKNKDFQGRPKKQMVTTLWFIFSTLFFTQNEKVKSILGKTVLIVWLFVVLIVTQSYTANLTSILTVEHLRPTINGISGLLASDVPIGYQTGSFVKEYLVHLGVVEERLKALHSISSYTEALSKGPEEGGVGAIVDELPYVQLFLSSKCDFKISGQEFDKIGWGFAFRKGSPLPIDISIAILSLAESGELQRIHDKWLKQPQCDTTGVESTKLGIGAFWCLFLITGMVSMLAIIFYFIHLLCEFHRYKGDNAKYIDDGENLPLFSRVVRFLKDFMAFIGQSKISCDRKKETNKTYKKKGKQKCYSSSSTESEFDSRIDNHGSKIISTKLETHNQMANVGIKRGEILEDV